MNPRRVFLVGGGPSLQGFDWKKLDGEIVLTVNAAALFMGEISPHSAAFVQDRRVLNEVLEGDPRWVAFRGRKFCVSHFEETVKEEAPSGVSRLYGIPQWLEPPYSVGEALARWGEPLGVLWSSHAGPAALNLAYQLFGCGGTFYLLGFDYSAPGTRFVSAPKNFHDEYIKRGWKHDETRMLEWKRWNIWRRDFEKAVLRLRENDVRVVNLSPFSTITGAERFDSSLVLEKIT